MSGISLTAWLSIKIENIVVAGIVIADPDALYATVKYDPDGNSLWVVHESGPVNWDGDVPLLALDRVGNVDTAGQSAGDYLTTKYSPDGVRIWQARYGEPEETEDQPTALAIDSLGYLYVTGKTGTTDTRYPMTRTARGSGPSRQKRAAWRQLWR
jgi:hypothetical protein